MGRTVARALWSTALVVGCVLAAVALLIGRAGTSRPAAVRPVDPGAPVRMATEPPRGPATPTPVPPLRSGARPVAVRIAVIDVIAPVVAVGVDGSGAVAIPERVATV